MNHIVDACPLTKFEGGLNLLHEADDDAVIHVAGIYSDCSTREMNEQHVADAVAVPGVRERHDGRQLAAVEGESSGVHGGAVAVRRAVGQQALPGAVLRVVQQRGAALHVGVHVEQQLVALGAHVHQLLVERQLELVHSLRVHLHPRPSQTVARLHRSNLRPTYSQIKLSQSV